MRIYMHVMHVSLPYSGLLKLPNGRFVLSTETTLGTTCPYYALLIRVTHLYKLINSPYAAGAGSVPESQLVTCLDRARLRNVSDLFPHHHLDKARWVSYNARARTKWTFLGNRAGGRKPGFPSGERRNCSGNRSQIALTKQNRFCIIVFACGDCNNPSPKKDQRMTNTEATTG
jgi:hypothetical protein